MRHKFTLTIAFFFGLAVQSLAQSQQKPDQKLFDEINQLKHNFSKYYFKSPDSVLYIIDHSIADFPDNKLANAWKDHLKGTYYYRRQIADSALFYYDKCLNIIKPDEEVFLYNESKIMSSLVLNNIGKPDKALAKLDEAAKVLNNLEKVNPFFQINLNRAYGAYYGTVHNNQKSISYYLNAINILEKNYTKIDQQKMKIKANLFINIGDIFFREGNYDKAKKYFKKSLEVCKDIDFDYGIMQNKLQIAESDYALGLAGQMATDSLKNIQKYFLKKNVVLLDVRVNTLLGDIYFDQKDVQNARKHYLKAYELSQSHQYVKGVEQLLFKLGETAYLTNNLEQETAYFNQCISTTEQSGNLDLQKNSYEYLARIFEQQKQYQKANKYYKKVLKLTDSLQSASQNKTIQELEAKYQNEKKAKQIAILESNNKLVKEQKANQFKLLSLGGLALLLVSLLAFLVYKNNQKRKHHKAQRMIANKLLASQMEALRARMNPHFLFNSLNSIKSYMISNKPDEAARYLSKFAVLVRRMLHHSKEKLISLRDEIDSVKTYLEVEKLRLKNKFDYTINIANNIELDDILLPPLLIQPFVENAIWHGFSGLDKKGQLTINVYQQSHETIIEIIDNGIGRKQAQKQQFGNHQSVSSTLIERTIEVFKKEGKLHIDIQTTDLYSKENKALGTKVTIKISEKF